jgi:TolB protein
VEGYGHHVYLEGYELPTVAAGPVDAAAAPDGSGLVVSARGWLWMLDPEAGTATRLTSGGAMDTRPAWSPDGGRIAFVRDDGRDTDIWELDVATGDERPLVETPALDLDPAFGADGSLWYASAVDGTLDVWHHPRGADAPTRVTEARGIELRPQPHPDGRHLVYVAKRGGPDRIVLRELATGEERRLHEGAILSQLRPALSPDGTRVVFQTPQAQGDGWELRLVSVERPGASVLLAGAGGERLPLAPAWSADGETVVFAEADREERMGLWRISADGGVARPLPVEAWAWGETPARLRIHTRRADGSPVPARLAVRDGDGHPALPDEGQAWFDGQTGTVFFYGGGVVELELPAGRATVTAARGLAAPATSATVELEPGGVGEVVLELEPLWDAAAAGWMSGDHHFHLNYGGPYRLDPEDVEALVAGEALEVTTPVVANLHDRFGEQAFWGWSNGGEPPLIRFGQEVRSHFLGHMGLLGTEDLFWPWVWGPGYEVYGADDRPNAVATAHARSQGGLSTYVHPVSGPDPFAQPGAPSLPTELVADAVTGDLDAIELACLWSDERGTAEAWYRFLNLGRPVAPTAGTDVMTDFFRTMALGTTRVYVHTGEDRTFEGYLDGLKAGRSFVTNGPLLDLRVEEARPGGTVEADGAAEWTLAVHSAVPVDAVELLVNGEVVWSGAAPDAPGSRRYAGTVELPVGGWIAARVTGPEVTAWPAMDSYAFGHTAPVWIGAVGSTEPAAQGAAAADLLEALEGATQRLRLGYAGADIPRLEAHFTAARAELERILGR